jgi:hypothetical protein
MSTAARRLSRRGTLIAGVFLGLVLVLDTAHAFDLRDVPPGTRLTMNLDLPAATFQSIGYGQTSWARLAERALARWNAVGVGPSPDFTFFAVRSPTTFGDPCTRDGINEVRFASTFCGRAWGDAVAFTVSRFFAGGRVVETDVVFNVNVPMNAYPGPVRQAAQGGTLYDFYRIALHEFGHAAGLDHPDEAGQLVVALMNTTFGSLDELQLDDVAGIHTVAWVAPTAQVRFSPLDDSITELVQEILGRAPAPFELAGWRFHILANPTAAGIGTFGHALFDGGEYLSKPSTPRAYVTLLYRSILDREPDPGGLESWLQLLQAQFDTALPGFVNSQEFGRIVPSTQDQAAVRAVVTRLYQQVLGRQPAATEVTQWANYVVATGDLVGMARGFFGSAEYNGRARTLSEHVVILYRTFLGREPAAHEIPQWVNYLQSFRVAVEDAFINSAEFQRQLAALL